MSSARWLVGALLALTATTALAAKPWVHSGHWETRYDRDFQKYAKRYFGPFFDWHWFKSQAIVESTLRPHAHNPSGAYGLMQVTPRTYKYLKRRYGLRFGSLREPRWNIATGIWYDHHLYASSHWDDLPARQRLYFAFASYNAGLTGVLRAYNKTPPAVTKWHQVARHAPPETRNYVRRIIRVKTNSPPAWERAPIRARGASAALHHKGRKRR